MSWDTSTRHARLPPDWRRRRALILQRDPVCRICNRRPSTEVDHIRPGDDHSDANLQGACSPCHAAKTKRESAAARWRFTRKRPEQRHPGLL